MKILNIFISEVEVEDENEVGGYDTLEEAIKKAEGETTGTVPITFVIEKRNGKYYHKE